jgi:hypothetical protein
MTKLFVREHFRLNPFNDRELFFSAGTTAEIPARSQSDLREIFLSTFFPEERTPPRLEIAPKQVVKPPLISWGIFVTPSKPDASAPISFTVAGGQDYERKERQSH